MCYSIVRYKMKDGKTEFAEAKAAMNEASIVKEKSENPDVSKIEIFRYHDGQQRTVRWENCNPAPRAEIVSA